MARILFTIWTSSRVILNFNFVDLNIRIVLICRTFDVLYLKYIFQTDLSMQTYNNHILHPNTLKHIYQPN